MITGKSCHLTKHPNKMISIKCANKDTVVSSFVGLGTAAKHLHDSFISFLSSCLARSNELLLQPSIQSRKASEHAARESLFKFYFTN